jgi:hypothetical protein
MLKNKKNFFLAVLFASFSLGLFSFAKATNHATLVATKKDTIATADTSTIIKKVSLSNTLFTELNLQQAGLSMQALDYAVKGYQKLVDEGAVTNDQYLTIVDFSQSSRSKRFYILDMKNHKLAWNTYVAHGKNSGVDMAEHFSNQPNSEASSLGFYVTKSTYSGKHGLSLRISGMEDGFNDNAEARGVVVHGAPYVNASRAHSEYMGRSQGCPALPENEYAQVINIIKGGSVMFLYYPSDDYLQSSTLLN